MIAALALALCSLTAADAASAARAGAAMAAAREPYTVRPWVLWDSKDPLRAAPGRADLDAVIVETPYERVRYEAYMERLQGLPLGPAQIARWRRESDRRLGFVIYAHSVSGEKTDAHFLARFSDPALVLRDGERAAAPERSIFGPSPDFYDVGTSRDERYTGALTYRFRDPGTACPAGGTLRFADAQHRPYAFSFTLARYR